MNNLQKLLDALKLESNQYCTNDWEDGYQSGMKYVIDSLEPYIGGVQGGSDASSTD